jgi:hypothetical protein
MPVPSPIRSACGLFVTRASRRWSSLTAARMIGLHRDRIDHPDVQLARDDHRRNQPAARDRHHGLPGAPCLGPLPLQPPGQRAGVAVDLVPADMEPLFMRQAVIHGVSLQVAAILMPSKARSPPKHRSITVFKADIARPRALKRKDARDGGVPQRHWEDHGQQRRINPSRGRGRHGAQKDGREHHGRFGVGQLRHQPRRKADRADRGNGRLGRCPRVGAHRATCQAIHSRVGRTANLKRPKQRRGHRKHKVQPEHRRHWPRPPPLRRCRRPEKRRCETLRSGRCAPPSARPGRG